MLFKPQTWVFIFYNFWTLNILFLLKTLKKFYHFSIYNLVLRNLKSRLAIYSNSGGIGYALNCKIFSRIAANLVSVSSKSVTAVPSLFPALPVLPTLWIWVSESFGF